VQYGIEDRMLDPTLPFAGDITAACVKRNFSRDVLYAIGWREAIGEYGLAAATKLQDGADPATGLMPDGTNAGHGAFQLTSSWPGNWQDVAISAIYAIDVFLQPNLNSIRIWAPALLGDELVKVLAASYNAGLTAAWNAHLAGNVDAATTNNYGAGVLAIYDSLVEIGRPPDPDNPTGGAEEIPI
jgi:hypothetical protein